MRASHVIERVRMIDVDKKKGTIKFSFKPAATVKSVKLAGSFNKWKPETMKKQKDGQYSCKVELTKGIYEYKFVVDGSWINDSDNPQCVWNQHGTLNSVLTVQ